MIKSAAEILLVVLAIIAIGCTAASIKLDKNGYELPVGWQSPSQAEQSLADCSSEPLLKHGFPLAEKRPGQLPGSCGFDDNKLAFIFNNSIYGASYLLIVGAVIMGAKSLRGRHE